MTTPRIKSEPAARSKEPRPKRPANKVDKVVKLYDAWNEPRIMGSKGESAATLLRFILGHENLDEDDKQNLVGCVASLLDKEDS